MFSFQNAKKKKKKEQPRNQKTAIQYHQIHVKSTYGLEVFETYKQRQMLNIFFSLVDDMSIINFVG